MTTPNAYAAAGVDTEAGDRAAELMKASVQRTHNRTVVAGAGGGFAGAIDASELRGYRRPLLVSSTDGVGTKVAIAQALGKHDTIGQDLVAMVVDDITVLGAKPLLMTDYIACGKVVPETIAEIVSGIARACAEVDCPLVGGETAEHPGLLLENEYDVAGAVTGVVEAGEVLGPDRILTGDVIIAMESSGVHSNGYSLVRHVFDEAGWGWDRHLSEFGASLGEVMLTPTRLYSKVCLELAREYGPEVTSPDAPVFDRGLHAFAHITGGGLAANLARVIPVGLTAVIDRDAWTVPPVFHLIREVGKIDWTSMEDTLNLGVGMVAVVAASRAEEVIASLENAGCPSWVIGEVCSGAPAAELPQARSHAARVVSGTKGTRGGAVLLRHEYAR